MGRQEARTKDANKQAVLERPRLQLRPAGHARRRQRKAHQEHRQRGCRAGCRAPRSYVQQRLPGRAKTGISCHCGPPALPATLPRWPPGPTRLCAAAHPCTRQSKHLMSLRFASNIASDAAAPAAGPHAAMCSSASLHAPKEAPQVTTARWFCMAVDALHPQPACHFRSTNAVSCLVPFLQSPTHGLSTWELPRMHTNSGLHVTPAAKLQAAPFWERPAVT